MTDDNCAVKIKRTEKGEFRAYFMGQPIPGVTCIDAHSKCGDVGTVTLTLLSPFFVFETDVGE